MAIVFAWSVIRPCSSASLICQPFLSLSSHFGCVSHFLKTLCRSQRGGIRIHFDLRKGFGGAGCHGGWSGAVYNFTKSVSEGGCAGLGGGDERGRVSDSQRLPAVVRHKP